MLPIFKRLEFYFLLNTMNISMMRSEELTLHDLLIFYYFAGNCNHFRLTCLFLLILIISCFVRKLLCFYQLKSDSDVLISQYFFTIVAFWINRKKKTTHKKLFYCFALNFDSSLVIHHTHPNILIAYEILLHVFQQML